MVSVVSVSVAESSSLPPVHTCTPDFMRGQGPTSTGEPSMAPVPSHIVLFQCSVGLVLCFHLIDFLLSL